jgi:hypothetical protein
MRRAAATLLLAGALVGCNGAGGKRHAVTLQPRPVALPGLPAQGLVVPRSRGVALVGLDGRVVARLPHFEAYPSGDTRRDELMHDLDWAGLLEQPRLVMASDRYYRIDASRHALIPVSRPRVPLPGDAELVGGGDVGNFRGLSVTRGGHVLIPRDLRLVVVAGALVQSRGRLLDLRTGRSWRLPPHCIGAGAHGDAAYALCATGPPVHYAGGVEPYPHTWLERITRRRGATKVVELSRDGPFQRLTAALSPNGRFVAEQTEETCGSGYLYVAATDGALGGRLVSGQRWTGARPNSTFVGWSADGRVVAQIRWGADCERPKKQGIYLVDPRTLKRTDVVRDASAMWNAFP